jgi:PEP-CTERM motif
VVRFNFETRFNPITKQTKPQKTNPTINMKTTNRTMKTQKLIKLLPLVGLLMAWGISANAQLQHYYDFSTGTGNDQVGTANGTLSGGITISGGALVGGGNNGGITAQWGGGGPMLILNSSVVSGINGAFTIEDWFTATTGWPKYDSLYAFSDGSDPGSQSASYLLAVPVRGYSPWPSGIAVVGAGGISRPAVGWDLGMEGIYLDTPGVHQTVLTYDGTSFRYYVDGALSTFGIGGGPLSDPGFNLSSLPNVAIAGGSPYNDPAMTGSTYSFAIFNGAATADQVASLYSLGTQPTVEQIGGVGVVPEPGTMALLALGGVGLLFWRRRQAR